MTIQTANDLDFDRAVLAADRPVLVDFGAEWCSPCRRQDVLLEKLAAERDDVLVVKVDAEESPETARTYGVRGLPTLLLFRGGEPVARAVGLQHPSALVAMLEE